MCVDAFVACGYSEEDAGGYCYGSLDDAVLALKDGTTLRQEARTAWFVGTFLRPSRLRFAAAPLGQLRFAASLATKLMPAMILDVVPEP